MIEHYVFAFSYVFGLLLFMLAGGFTYFICRWALEILIYVYKRLCRFKCDESQN